jgi:hypothetical protein
LTLLSNITPFISRPRQKRTGFHPLRQFIAPQASDIGNQIRQHA